jgi:hypothetical protein
MKMTATPLSRSAVGTRLADVRQDRNDVGMMEVDDFFKESQDKNIHEFTHYADKHDGFHHRHAERSPDVVCRDGVEACSARNTLRLCPQKALRCAQGDAVLFSALI